jgi:integrase
MHIDSFSAAAIPSHTHLYRPPKHVRALRPVYVAPPLTGRSRAQAYAERRARVLPVEALHLVLVKTARRRRPRPYQFWAPRLALYAGLRGGDIVTLLTQEIVEIEGRWWFVLHRRFGRGRLPFLRRIPVHEALLADGWLEYLATRSRDPEARVFPELMRERRSGVVIHAWMKRWGQVHWPADAGPQPTMCDLRLTFLDAVAGQKVAWSTLREWAGRPPVMHYASDPGPLDDEQCRITALCAVDFGLAPDVGIAVSEVQP